MRRRGLLLLWAGLAVGAQTLPGWLARSAARAEPPAEGEAGPVLTYVIRASLDPQSHVVEGRGTLTWRNTTSVAVPDFHLHLYLNAFRDRHSTFLRESLTHRDAKYDEAHPGSIEVTSFRPTGGAELRPQASFASCDDANPDDQTVLVLPLPEPIAPGAAATFEIAFTSRLPKAFARTGFGGDYHMVAQWFPKPGVFEEVPEAGQVGGAWNCHQFHGSSEFFADYGSYDVSLTVPKAYEGRVGATGLLTQTTPDAAAGTVTYRYEAKDVHDFAWVCDTDFVVKEHVFPGGDAGQPEAQKRAAALLGREPQELNLKPVKVTLLLQPEHADQEERHKNAVFAALTHMGFWFGAYPYATLTVVDPDHRAEDTGGMEYPTLITGGTDYCPPERGWDPEFVLVHEFGHQYFYGIVGTNEFENAWMDEGLNTYGTARTMVAAYRPRPPITTYGPLVVYAEKPIGWNGLLDGVHVALPNLEDDAKFPFGSIGVVKSLGHGLGLEPKDRLPLVPKLPDAGPIAYLREAPFLTLLPVLPIRLPDHERGRVAGRIVVDPIAGVKAWEYMDGRSYGQNSYPRTAAALRTVEGLVGEATVVKGLRTYVERYGYRHPVPANLFDTLAEVAEKDGHPGLRETLHTLFERADLLDYGIGSIDILGPEDEEDEHDGEHVHPPSTGPVPSAPIPESASPAPLEKPAKRPFESTVVVRRHGDQRLPVDVRVGFEDGKERLVRWELDGRVVALDGEAPPHQPVASRGEQGRWTKIRFVGPSKVAWAEVDPERKLALEHDRTNDGLAREPEGPSPVLPLSVKVLGWVEMMTSFYGGL
jgi:hypothetical protein